MMRSLSSILMAEATWSFLLFPRLRKPAFSTPKRSTADCSIAWWISSNCPVVSGAASRRNFRHSAPIPFLTSPARISVSMCAVLILMTCLAMGASNPMDEMNPVALSLDLFRRFPLISSGSPLTHPGDLGSDLGSDAGLEPPELYETNRIPLVEGRTLIVGRQLQLVERVLR